MNAFKKTFLLQRTCKEVTALVIAREDRALPLAERVALRFHMVICDACPRFARQIFTLRSAMAQWRNYGAGDDPGDGPGTPQGGAEKAASAAGDSHPASAKR